MGEAHIHGTIRPAHNAPRKYDKTWDKYRHVKNCEAKAIHETEKPPRCVVDKK